MEKRTDSRPEGLDRVRYEVPKAERLSDTTRASGGQCYADGNTASLDCHPSGSGASSCLGDGGAASLACSAEGMSAHECASSGNQAPPA